MSEFVTIRMLEWPIKVDWSQPALPPLSPTLSASLTLKSRGKVAAAWPQRWETAKLITPLPELSAAARIGLVFKPLHILI
jgi:hypothetical protein